MDHTDTRSSLFRTWWGPGLLALLFVALLGMLALGGIARVWAWYQTLSLLPFVGLVYLIGVVVRIIWKRHFTKAVGATLAMSLVAITPITWSLRLWPVAFPANIDSTEPTLLIRVPTDEAMRVAWGGDAAAGNQHAITSNQRWAYDLMIEPYLTGSATLADYGCYGVPVVAPIGGKVVQTVSDEPDANPGSISGNVTAPSGNHVIIEVADGGHLIIAHLKPDSVTVRSGDRVNEGDVIGACGNSGNTSEPHVHIHYQRQHPKDVRMNFAEGRPLYFRDHGGPAMPSGGLTHDGEQIVAIGDIIEHRGR